MMNQLRYARWAQIVTTLALLIFMGACSDDDTSGDGVDHGCEPGERYNSLTGECVSEGRVDPDRDASSPGAQTPDATPTPDPDAGGTPDPGQPDAGPTQPDAGPTQPDAGPPPRPDVSGEECGPGNIIGMACAPSGATLGNATVTLEGVDCDGEPFTMTTQTNHNGEYEFNDVPAGAHDLSISTGSFSGTDRVFVTAGNTTDLTQAAAKICLNPGNVEIAVIQGIYDSVEDLLGDLGLDYEIKGGDQVSFPTSPLSQARSFLGDLDAMRQYDIIFINCGELWTNIGMMGGNQTAIVDNLRDYVNGGGSLYASDWAHHFVAKMFPDMIEFYGDSANTSSALMGFAPQTISAGVTSSGLQTALGHNDTVIDFPHEPLQNVLNNNWAVATGAGPETTVHLQGDVALCSSATSCSSQGGSVPDAPLLLSYQTPGNGTVFFTSFHNDSQMGISDDMEEILRFLIFQL